MKTIALVTQKGGSGKSTLAASLAVAAGTAGEKVFLLDLDKQGTLASWIERREAETPAFDRIAGETALISALKQIGAAGFTFVILDTAGTDSPLATAAIRTADLCLVPTRPTPADMEATRPTLAAINAIGKPFAFVLTQTPPRSSRLSEASAGLKMLGMLAEPAITARNDHQDAIGSGLGVTEFNQDGKAAIEIRALWKWISKRIAS